MNQSMIKRVGWLAGLLGLMVLVPAVHAQNNALVNLDVKDMALRDALDILAGEAGIEYIIKPDVDPAKKVTLTIENRPVETVLRLLLQAAGGLEYALEEGVYVIGLAGADDAPTRPTAPMAPAGPTGTRPTPPPPPRPSTGGLRTPGTTRPGGTRPGASGALDTGNVTVESKRYDRIVIRFGSAPALASIFDGGVALYHSQLDPWSSIGGGGGGGGFGGGMGGGFGGGRGGRGF